MHRKKKGQENEYVSCMRCADIAHHTGYDMPERGACTSNQSTCSWYFISFRRNIANNTQCLVHGARVNGFHMHTTLSLSLYVILHYISCSVQTYNQWPLAEECALNVRYRIRGHRMQNSDWIVVIIGADAAQLLCYCWSLGTSSSSVCVYVVGGCMHTLNTFVAFRYYSRFGHLLNYRARYCQIR